MNKTAFSTSYPQKTEKAGQILKKICDKYNNKKAGFYEYIFLNLFYMFFNPNFGLYLLLF